MPALTTENLVRELQKIADVVEQADRHFDAEAQMNAALHMSPIVRPAPLAIAVHNALFDLRCLIIDVVPAEGRPGTPSEVNRLVADVGLATDGGPAALPPAHDDGVWVTIDGETYEMADRLYSGLELKGIASIDPKHDLRLADPPSVLDPWQAQAVRDNTTIRPVRGMRFFSGDNR